MEGVNLRHEAEEEAVAGHGVGNAGAAEDGGVEGGKGRDERAQGDDDSAPLAQETAGHLLRHALGALHGCERQDVEVGGVDEEIHQHHTQGAENECARDVALRVAHFLAHHGQVVPAVVSPQRRHQRHPEGAEGAHAFGRGEEGLEGRRGCVSEDEGQRRQRQDDGYFHHGEHSLHRAAQDDAQVVDDGQADDGGERNHLRAGERPGGETQRQPQHLLMQRAEEVAQEKREGGGDGGDGAGLADDERFPPVEVAPERPVGAPEENVLAPRLRHGRAQLGVAQRAGQREQPAHDPDQEDQSDRIHLPCDGGGHQENSRADDGAGHDGAGAPNTQSADQLRLCAHASSGAGLMILRSQPTRKVASVPTSTYQVQAKLVKNLT